MLFSGSASLENRTLTRRQQHYHKANLQAMDRQTSSYK